ncbi:MAG: hypothetical protein FH762_07710 [Firmicutes bacterium]|nr:hypothetical protein [Bacillota bacterium]
MGVNMKRKNKKKMQAILFNLMSVVNICIFVVVLLTVFVVIFNNSMNMIKKSRLEVLEQIGKRNEIINNVVVYMADNIFETLGSELISQKKDYEQLTKGMDSVLDQNSRMLKKIQMEPTIIAIMRDGYEYYSAGETKENVGIIKNSMWYINNFTNNEDEFWTVRFNVEDNIINMKLSYGKILRDNNKEYKGIIIASITEKTLNNVYADVSDTEKMIYILDENGKAISHSIQSLVGNNLYYMPAFFDNYGKNSSVFVARNTKHVLLTNYYSEQTGWVIVEEIPVKSLLKSYSIIVYMAIYLLIFSTTISFIAVYYTSRKISKPMADITNKMIYSSENEFSKIDIQTEYREAYILSNIFNMTINKMNRLIEKIKDEERNKRKFELSFLRAQINPHFLHNTLFSIKCLIEMNKSEKANIMLSNLMKTLKMHINASKEFISISEEIEYLKNYVSLMQNRYDDRKLTLNISVDDDLLELYIPRLMLQPIVENSIFHGFEKKVVDPVININIDDFESSLIIRISDNGGGMTTEEIDNLWRNSYKKNSKFKQIGLINIKKRIELLFGEENGITVISEPQKGTEVILKLRKVLQEGINGTDINS